MVEIGAMSLDRFATVLDPGLLTELEAGILLGRSLFAGRAIWNRQLDRARRWRCRRCSAPCSPTPAALGVDTRWAVIEGNEQFFAITKRIHNRLHGYPGDGGPLGDTERAAYEATLAPSAQAFMRLIGPGDVVILHDPQTAGLIPAVRSLGVPVVWRCHVGVDAANRLARDTWAFLAPYVSQADATVFSRQSFAWDVLDGVRRSIITPTIDALASKNELLDEPTVRSILVAAGLRAGPADGASPAFTRMDGTKYGAGVTSLLLDPDRAAKIGAAAQEHIREQFLGPKSLLAYLYLLESLLV